MRIGVLCSPESWVFQELQRAANDEHKIVALSFTQLAAHLDGTETTSFETRQSSGEPIRLENLDAILIRPMPIGSLQQIVFRMNILHQLLQQHHLVILNSPQTIEMSVDKYLCLEKIRGGKIDIPRTFLAESPSIAMEQFQRLDMDSVIKPLFGSGGNGIERAQDTQTAIRIFSQKAENNQIIYQQEFIDHGDTDLRLLVIGERVLGMRRTHPGQWITNIQQGASACPHAPTDEEKEIALLATNRIGAKIAGVDLMYDQAGKPWVIEVNACPGWQAMSTICKHSIASLVLSQITDDIKKSRRSTKLENETSPQDC